MRPMKHSIELALLFVGIVLAGGIATLLLKDKSHPKDRAKEVAEKALLASVDRPETVKIQAVSTPDSVFGRDYITQEEKMAISVAMMKVNEKVMKETDGFENMDFGCRLSVTLCLQKVRMTRNRFPAGK